MDTWERRLHLLQIAAGVAMLIAAGWGALIVLGVLSARNLSLMLYVLVGGLAAALVAVLGRRALRAAA